MSRSCLRSKPRNLFVISFSVSPGRPDTRNPLRVAVLAKLLLASLLPDLVVRLCPLRRGRLMHCHVIRELLQRADLLPLYFFCPKLGPALLTHSVLRQLAQLPRVHTPPPSPKSLPSPGLDLFHLASLLPEATYLNPPEAVPKI